MFPSLQLTLGVALFIGCGFLSAQARSSGTPPDDRWNPQHIGSLPAEIREAIAPYASRCGASLAAEHSFARYFQSGNAKLIGLHFEHLRCAGWGCRLQARRLPTSGLHLDRRTISTVEKLLRAGA
jgi:hypothetical protein